MMLSSALILIHCFVTLEGNSMNDVDHTLLFFAQRRLTITPGSRPRPRKWPDEITARFLRQIGGEASAEIGRP